MQVAHRQHFNKFISFKKNDTIHTITCTYILQAVWNRKWSLQTAHNR